MNDQLASRREAAAHLPSWNETPRRRAIVDFVRAVSTPDHPDHVPAAQRIAVFDHDGTLWCERPIPFQLYFAMDRLDQLADADALHERQPFTAFLERDVKTLATFSKREVIEAAARLHMGLRPEEFDDLARAWLDTAQHPVLNRRFLDCTYQPQLELLSFLRRNDFKVFIVSGGSVAFIRAFAEDIYGVPPEQVIGSSVRAKLGLHGQRPVLFELGQLRSFDDREEKVVNFELHVGRRPILAFGNSDGDLRMLQYTAAGPGRTLALLLHHDDVQREFEYDRDFRLSPLDEALQQAHEQGWSIVSMKHDWRSVFPEWPARPAEPSRLEQAVAD